MRLPAALRSIFRPSLQSPLTLAWLTALWLAALCNWPLWQRMAALPELGNARGLLFIALFVGMVTALFGALLSLLAWRAIVKPVLAVCLLGAAALAHFIGSYGIVVDPTMVINIVQTDVREAGDLLSPRLAASLALLAGVPIAWLWRRRIEPQRWTRRLALNLASFVAGIALMVALALLGFADLASTMRNHKSLRYMISPVNAFYSGITVAVRAGAAPKGPPEIIAADAKLAARPAGARPPLVLLVVGETARAANFSLNGYARPTNPELAKLPVASFRKVTSCGTSTAASLPCMFSHLGREKFGDLKGRQETLLDALQRAGLAVLWLDNQAGCKGVCDRVPNASTVALPPGAPPLPAGLCDGEECLDAALLHGLDQRLAALDPARVAKGVVLVMHQMGSHGPAYFKRSPPDRKPFEPECRSNALQQCARAEVVNGYDNSIAYTDHILAGAIVWLKAQERRFDTTLLYVSDHGESLGENNLYLHGMPYGFAPREQIEVPLIVWIGAQDGRGPVAQCLSKRLDEPLSHDHLFHTMLGLAGVEASVYRRELDFVAPCRPR